MLSSPLVSYISSICHSFHSLKASSSFPGISVGDWSREVESLYLVELSSDCISVVEAFSPQKDLTAPLKKQKQNKNPSRTENQN